VSAVEEYMEKTVEELEKILFKLKDELEEVEEERMFIMGQTGIHLPGATVKKYEAEVQGLKDRIEACETALNNKKAS